MSKTPAEKKALIAELEEEREMVVAKLSKASSEWSRQQAEDNLERIDSCIRDIEDDCV